MLKYLSISIFLLSPIISYIIGLIVTKLGFTVGKSGWAGGYEAISAALVVEAIILALGVGAGIVSLLLISGNKLLPLIGIIINSVSFIFYTAFLYKSWS